LFGGGGGEPIGQFAGAQVRGNRWSTDLRGPGRFVNRYGPGRPPEGETFAGAFGPAGG
jgi:hypothetical protein